MGPMIPYCPGAHELSVRPCIKPDFEIMQLTEQALKIHSSVVS
ncbi:unnamed protein product, partial [Staurois parvus]